MLQQMVVNVCVCVRVAGVWYSSWITTIHARYKPGFHQQKFSFPISDHLKEILHMIEKLDNNVTSLMFDINLHDDGTE
jgi:hypothetical protein